MSSEIVLAVQYLLSKTNAFNFIILTGGKFLMQNVKRGDGSNRCYFIVTNEGRPVKQQRTLFTECFYLMAMSELARATHNQKYMVTY